MIDEKRFLKEIKKYSWYAMNSLDTQEQRDILQSRGISLGGGDVVWLEDIIRLVKKLQKELEEEQIKSVLNNK